MSDSETAALRDGTATRHHRPSFGLHAALVAVAALPLLLSCDGASLNLGDSDPSVIDRNDAGSQVPTEGGSGGSGGSAGFSGSGGGENRPSAGGAGGGGSGGGGSGGGGSGGGGSGRGGSGGGGSGGATGSAGSAGTAGEAGMAGDAGGGDAGLGCPADECPRVELASGQDYPGELAIDDDTVFWVNRTLFNSEPVGSVSRVSKLGGNVTTVVSGLTGALGLAVDATHVYFSDFHRVRRVSKSGGIAALLFENDRSVPVDITVAGTDVFWGDAWPDHGLWRLTGASSQATEVAPGEYFVNAIALDASHVYWHSNVISRKARAGGPTEVVVDPVSGETIDDLALTPTDVFAFGSAVVRYPRDGSAPTKLSLHASHRGTVDGEFVYWTDLGGTFMDDGKIWRAPLEDGSPSIVASGLSLPWGIVIDSTSIYWTEQGSYSQTGMGSYLTPMTGKVTKMKKPAR